MPIQLTITGNTAADIQGELIQLAAPLFGMRGAQAAAKAEQSPAPPETKPIPDEAVEIVYPPPEPKRRGRPPGKRNAAQEAGVPTDAEATAAAEAKTDEQLAESVAETVPEKRAVEGAFEAKAEKAAAAAEPESEYTISQCREALLAVSGHAGKGGGTEGCRALLDRFGVARVRDLAKDRYGEFLTAAQEVIGNG